MHSALADAFSEWPDAVAGPVPLSEVEDAEQLLGVKLPDDFREFPTKKRPVAVCQFQTGGAHDGSG